MPLISDTGIALRAYDSNGDPVSGATLDVYLSGTTTPVSVYSDSALSVVHSKTANAAGVFDPVYVAAGSLKVDVSDPDTDASLPGYPIDNVTVGSGGTLANAAAVIADTRGYDVLTAGEVIVEDEYGFRYKVAASDATDHHTTNAGGAKLYIEPDRAGVVSLYQWGLTPDGSTDIRSSLQTAVDNFSQIHIPATEEHRPVGTNVWYCSGTININKTVRVFGASGTQAGLPPSIIKWPTGVPGIIVHYYDTEGDASGNVTTNSLTSLDPYGIGSIIENLGLIAGDAADPTIDDTSHAVWLKARASIRDNYISGWGGNGIHIVASTSSSNALLRGNANNWDTTRNRVQNCSNGMYIDGADVNASVSMHDDFSSNAGWGVWDSSFLGTSFVGLHTNGNGDAATRQYNQKRYQCIDEDASGSTTPGTDPDVWWESGTAGTGSATTWVSGTTYAVNDYVLSSTNRVYKCEVVGGGASTVEPTFTGEDDTTLSDGYQWDPTAYDAWVSGETVPTGGSKLVDSNNAQTLFVGCYDESGQAVKYEQKVCAIYPGHGFDQMADGRAMVLTQNGWTVLKCEREKEDGETVTYHPFGTFGGSGKLRDVHIGSLEIDSLVGTQRVDLVDDTRGAIVRRDRNSDGSMTWMETLDGTSEDFGRTSAVPHAKYIPRLFLGSSASNGRQVTFATAEPSSGEYARGDVIFNQNPSAGGSMGWVCTTGGTAGTDAVFKAMPNLAA